MSILDRKGLVRTFKRVVHPSRFIGMRGYKALVRRQADVLIGHTRAASVGSVVKENAHPFTFEGVTGVHNGTVTNQREMEMHTGQSFTSDSQHLLWSLAHTGGLGPAEGGINLAYWDQRWTDGLSLRLQRYNRPLAMAYVEMAQGVETVVFSSELGHLRAACTIAEVDITAAWKIENYTQVDLFNNVKKGIVEIDEYALEVPLTYEGFMGITVDEDPEVKGSTDIDKVWGYSLGS